MTRLTALIAALFLSIVALPAQAQDLSGLSKQERADTLRFAVNNGLFTLYHEVAHLLIDKLGLPVLGKEEDAADNIATWILLNKNTPDANQTLEDAVDGWVLTGQHYGDYFEGLDYVSGYSPDRHRAMQIACLMIGADGSAFRSVARAYNIPQERQQSCFYDFEMMNQTLDGLLADTGTGTRVDVTYHDGGTRLRLAERVLRGSGIFDSVAEEVRKGYRLDGRVKFTAKRCGESNAFYDTNTTEVIFCYELMEEFLQLYVDDLPHRSRK
ncbi:Putative metallopeptidase [Devosia lucknowensis]|uniref:Putative metallopeptidase n=1 Tax=Devosia lucknowensis TaxID=1096929 RepID=A0A1Y6EQC9_9HYPH|nr:DUF4344 domain-containing metallopeptidase [Devosia lucknowensis]SMQ62373.1 Putative metallopeptidase [Devosia lucknowensis]